MALLRARQWAAAHYMAGYVVECSLKAVLAKSYGGVLPVSFHTHDLDELRSNAAGLLSQDDLKCLDGLSDWTHRLRYECWASPPDVVVKFIDRAKDVYRCLSIRC